MFGRSFLKKGFVDKAKPSAVKSLKEAGGGLFLKFKCNGSSENVKFFYTKMLYIDLLCLSFAKLRRNPESLGYFQSNLLLAQIGAHSV